MTPEVAGSNPARATPPVREVHDHTTGFCDLPAWPSPTHDSHLASPTSCFWSSSLVVR
jgi:hypothetical protein